MTNHEAWLYAASWGSYITSGDPGACMYGFDEKFRVRSENHRASCIAYVENIIAGFESGEYDRADFDAGEEQKLQQLMEKLKGAKLTYES